MLGPAEEDYILIDAGNKSFANKFFKALTLENIAPRQISHILITHAHHDHIGGLNQIKAKTGVRILIHDQEASILREGIITIPEGFSRLGKFVSFLGKQFLTGKKAYDPIQADLVISDIGLSFQDKGFPLEILHTPGHTAGSISILDTESSRMFCGDAAFNLPLLTSGKLHIYRLEADVPFALKLQPNL